MEHEFKEIIWFQLVDNQINNSSFVDFPPPFLACFNNKKGTEAKTRNTIITNCTYHVSLSLPIYSACPRRWNC